MTPSKPSRIPRLTSLPTPPPSPIIAPRKLTNQTTKRPFITRFKTPHLTVEDLYQRFHGKPRPSSLPARQISLPSALPSGQMRHRQMRITSYFKPAADSPACSASPPKAELASNKKHAHLKTSDQMT